MSNDRDDVPEYLAERLRDAIAVDSPVHELGIKVQVASGRVRLSGAVTTEGQRQAITELARRLAPEHDVVNEVEVVPSDKAHDEEDLR